MTPLERGSLWGRLLLLLLLLGTCGCGSPPGSSSTAEGEAPSSDEPDEPTDVEVAVTDKPFVLGDLVEPFEPPATLEDLDASVSSWVDGPVLDSLALLREQKKSEPPLVGVEKALAMRNDSDIANEEILSALSEVAPADGAGVDFDATINRTFQQDLRSLNPLLTSSVSEAQYHSMTVFGLFTYDWAMNPFASSDVVAKWQTSDDGMVDKVVIRDDLTWSDGEPITAHDVEFSFRVIMSSQVPVPAMRSGTEDLKAVKAYDDRTLVYFHKAPLATNVWNMNFYVLPKHLYEDSIAEDPTLRKSDHHAKLERKPVVGGPYEVVSRKRGQEVVLRRRESYYTYDGKRVRDKPYFKQIRYRIIEDQNTALLALKSGDIDEGLLGAEQWRTQTGGEDFYRENTKVRGKEWTFFYVCWNIKSPMFEDVRVRQALAHAMNYDEMLEDLCYGLYQQSTGIYHSDGWMYPKQPAPLLEYDLDKAEDLLDEAGWDDSDGDGVRDKVVNGRTIPFEFSLIVSNKPDRIAICNLLRENLESIGIICNVSPLEAAVLQERNFKKNFEASMAGWGAGADPYISVNIWGTGGNRNYGSYSNLEVDRLYEAAQLEFDRDKRAEMYGKIHNLIYEDQPYLFLYTRSSFYGFNKKLRGYRFSPRGPFSYSPGFGSIWQPADL